MSQTHSRVYLQDRRTHTRSPFDVRMINVRKRHASPSACKHRRRRPFEQTHTHAHPHRPFWRGDARHDLALSHGHVCRIPEFTDGRARARRCITVFDSRRATIKGCISHATSTSVFPTQAAHSPKHRHTNGKSWHMVGPLSGCGGRALLDKQKTKRRASNGGMRVKGTHTRKCHGTVY